MKKEEIVNSIYAAYGTDSGILFGIKERSVVDAIVEFTLARLPASSLNGSETGAWVRASDRTPMALCSKFIKRNDRKVIGHYKDGLFYVGGSESWNLVDVYWLDETPSPSPSTGIRDAVKNLLTHDLFDQHFQYGQRSCELKASDSLKSAIDKVIKALATLK